MRRAALAALPLLLAVACSGDDGGSPTLSVDDLDGATCPVELDRVDTVEREDAENAENGALVEELDAVSVSCDGTVGGAEVTVSLTALRREDLPASQAVLTTFPVLAFTLRLTEDQLQAVADDLDEEPTIGDAVDLRTDGPAAVAPVAIGGASSAALLVVVHDGPVAADTLVERLAATLTD